MRGLAENAARAYAAGAGRERNPFRRWVLSQNGLFFEPPQRHSAARPGSGITAPNSSKISKGPSISNGPLSTETIVTAAGRSSAMTSGASDVSRRYASAPDGQRSSAAHTSSTLAFSGATQRRFDTSNTAGNARRHAAA